MIKDNAEIALLDPAKHYVPKVPVVVRSDV